MNALGEAVCKAMVSGDIERLVNQRPIPASDPFLHEYQSDARIAKTLTRYRTEGAFYDGCHFTVVEGGAICTGEVPDHLKDWNYLIDPRGVIKPLVVQAIGHRLPDEWRATAFRYRFFGYEYSVAFESESQGFVLEFTVASLLEWFIGWHDHWLGVIVSEHSQALHWLNRCPAADRLLAARMKVGRTAPQYR
ncbi:MAG: hypothetical protein SFV21_21025 [Rhodospirillaceae bacterium]|nr:hypothetical protein [Rhodospirillaceae bacterium]